MRRAFLLGGAAAFATLILPRDARSGTVRRISLRHSATGARFTGIWHDGTAPDLSAMGDLSQALADPHCQPARAFDPETIEILWQVAQRTRLTDLDVHSGYRTPQVNRAVHGAGDSQHLRASAVDVGVPSGRLPAVAEAALKLGRGGVGVYRRRGFVHLDSGPVRRWSDAGGFSPGQRNPRLDRIDSIAEAWNRARI